VAAAKISLKHAIDNYLIRVVFLWTTSSKIVVAIETKTIQQEKKILSIFIRTKFYEKQGSYESLTSNSG